LVLLVSAPRTDVPNENLAPDAFCEFTCSV